MAAMLAAVTAQPPARAEEAAQHLVAAVRAAVAAAPSAGADMSAMVGWGEPLLAALWAAMELQPLPPSDELSSSFFFSSPVLSSCCLWHPVWVSILLHFLYFAPFFPFLVSRARLRVADIARSHSRATVPPVAPRALVKLWNPNNLVAGGCGRGRERLVPLTYSTPLVDR